MRLAFAFAFAVIGFVAAGSDMAGAAVYDCAFSDGTADRTWIQSQYLIEYDAAAGTARVIDPLINALHGGPIKAEVVEDTKGKIVFRWQVQTGDDGGQVVKMGYRATWFKGPQTMRIAAIPRGYDNMFEAQGRCKIDPNAALNG